MTVIFSDLHLREQSEDVCFRVLEWIERAAVEDDKRVVFCGDWWHIRYQLNVRLLNRVARVMRRWRERGIRVDLLPGNHDQVDVAGANALEVFGAFDNVTVWSEPGVSVDDEWGFVPYRKDQDEQIEGLLAVANERPKIIFGHLGLRGATMNNGRKDPDGIGLPSLGARLILGHYHKHHGGGIAGKGAWEYVGSPYQTSYGEAGNVCGCLMGGEFVPIDVGAPKHYILEWDPAVSDEPPENPGEPHDHVRLDIKATQEMIVKGKFKSVLKKHGLDDAQVSVVPVPVKRDVKLTLERGEPLISAVERFASERLGSTQEVISSGLADRTNPIEAVMEPLRRWDRCPDQS
jgi:DNA repair exonuclease SbcCD nuclease subunit